MTETQAHKFNECLSVRPLSLVRELATIIAT
jgi:hypothetical protein